MALDYSVVKKSSLNSSNIVDWRNWECRIKGITSVFLIQCNDIPFIKGISRHSLPIGEMFIFHTVRVVLPTTLARGS